MNIGKVNNLLRYKILKSNDDKSIYLFPLSVMDLIENFKTYRIMSKNYVYFQLINQQIFFYLIFRSNYFSI